MQTQFDIPRLQVAYSRLHNHKIYYGKNQSAPIYIMFSGNGLYFPNTERELELRIFVDDRYEWKNVMLHSNVEFSQLILIRDVRKTWYTDGISDVYNSVDSLIDFLKGVILPNRKIICVGNSAGGYMAMLVGSVFHAERIINISGRFAIDREVIDENPNLELALSDPTKSKWFDLRGHLLESGVPVFYIYSTHCEFDCNQLIHANLLPNVYALPVSSKYHGKGIPNWAYVEIFSNSVNTLTELTKSKSIRPASYYMFCPKHFGINQTIKHCMLYLYKSVLFKLRQ